MAKKQIINPYLRFGSRAQGPYANRISAGSYAIAPKRTPGEAPITTTLEAFSADASGKIRMLKKGQGVAVFVRSTQASVTDFEGIIRTALVNEIRFRGARRVENTCDANLSTAVLQPGAVITPLGNFQYNFDVSACATSQGVIGDTSDHAIDVVENSSVMMSFEMKAATAGSVRVNEGSGFATIDPGSSVAHYDFDVTTQWRRYAFIWSTGFYTYSGTRPIRFWFRKTVARLEAFDIRNMQLENITGQASQNPSSYVSKGKGEDHGTNIDGVANFNYQNGNTVDGNGVVTEAKGAAIADWYALFEPAERNYTDTSNNLSTAETVDLTSGGTGNYTLSVGGTAAVTVAAGTATGTGFGQATEGSPVTFNLTGAGTVTLTLNSGTLGRSQSGDYLKQIEKSLASSPSSFIASPGVGSTSRTADDGRPMFQRIGNIDVTVGTMVLDIEFDTDETAITSGFEYLVNTTDEYGQLYLSHSGSRQLRSYDQNNILGIDFPFAANNKYRVAVTWSSANGMNISWKDIGGAGSWQTWQNSAFDGAYDATEEINIASLIYRPFMIKALDVYPEDNGTAWVEDNY